LESLAPSALAKLNADQGSDLIALIEDCAQKLVKNDLAYPERLALLREQVKPTSEYRLLNQGVPSAGAMRERGRHATAFIGRRHFDEATLLDNLFEPASKYRH
jgi:hypothetical protein